MGFTKPFCYIAGVGAELSSLSAVEGLTTMSTDVVGLHQISVMIPPFDAASIGAELLPLLTCRLRNGLATFQANHLPITCL
jgi:hypothetical protein